MFKIGRIYKSLFGEKKVPRRKDAMESIITKRKQARLELDQAIEDLANSRSRTPHHGIH